MSTDSMMLSNYLILCHPLLFLPSIFPSIRVFSNKSALPIRWPKYWRSFNFSVPGGSDGKESTCNVENLSLIPGLGRSPGGGHGNPLPYSCLQKSPWTEEPGGLQSMGSQRVEHNCATKTFHFSKGPVKGQNQEQLISGATYFLQKNL